MSIRLGTRGSALALAQSGQVAARLHELAGLEVELVVIRTEGDVRTGSLRQLGGTGVFAAAIREALLDGRCELAVHSLKDLPTAAYAGLEIGAIPAREDPRDALCGSTLAALPPGARVGTGSPRRAAQLRALRSDLQVVDLRGNIDTRLGRVGPADLAAVVLARAGLSRLGRLDAVGEVLAPEAMLPAPGQGALAVECRAEATGALRAALRSLDDAPTRAAVLAERAVLAGLEAGCAAPVGALGQVRGDVLTLSAVACRPDGSAVLHTTDRGPVADPIGLGRRVADHLLGQGAGELAGLAGRAAPRGEELR